MDIEQQEKYKNSENKLEEPHKDNFNTDYDKSKVIDIDNFGIIKKRRREEVDDEIIEEGGKRDKRDT